MYAPEAKEDLKGIWCYIARDSPTAADGVLEKIRDTCRLIATQPGIGQSCGRYRRGLRQSISGKYVIFYLVHRKQKEVEIARVLHGARDIDRLF